MANKKKKYNARFPPARIKKIMQMDDNVGKVAVTVPLIISRALELFIETLMTDSYNLTLSKNAKTLSIQHVKQIILADKKCNFLDEILSKIPDLCNESENAMNPSISSSTNTRNTNNANSNRATNSIVCNKKKLAKDSLINDAILCKEEIVPGCDQDNVSRYEYSTKQTNNSNCDVADQPVTTNSVYVPGGDRNKPVERRFSEDISVEQMNDLRTTSFLSQGMASLPPDIKSDDELKESYLLHKKRKQLNSDNDPYFTSPLKKPKVNKSKKNSKMVSTNQNEAGIMETTAQEPSRNLSSKKKHSTMISPFHAESSFNPHITPSQSSIFTSPGNANFIFPDKQSNPFPPGPFEPFGLPQFQRFSLHPEQSTGPMHPSIVPLGRVALPPGINIPPGIMSYYSPEQARLQNPFYNLGSTFLRYPGCLEYPGHSSGYGIGDPVEEDCVVARNANVDRGVLDYSMLKR